MIFTFHTEDRWLWLYLFMSCCVSMVLYVITVMCSWGKESRTEGGEGRVDRNTLHVCGMLRFVGVGVLMGAALDVTGCHAAAVAVYLVGSGRPCFG